MFLSSANIGEISRINNELYRASFARGLIQCVAVVKAWGLIQVGVEYSLLLLLKFGV